jgi:hypothetical protein
MVPGSGYGIFRDSFRDLGPTYRKLKISTVKILIFFLSKKTSIYFFLDLFEELSSSKKRSLQSSTECSAIKNI